MTLTDSTQTGAREFRADAAGACHRFAHVVPNQKVFRTELSQMGEVAQGRKRGTYHYDLGADKGQ